SALARVEPKVATPLRLCYAAFTDPARTSASVREGLARAFAALPANGRPSQLIPLAFAALRIDVLSSYRHLCQRTIEQERDGGSIAYVLLGLLLLSVDSYHRGQWDESETLANEGLDLAITYGYQLLEAPFRNRIAFVAAGRGNVDLARALTDKVTNWTA